MDKEELLAEIERQGGSIEPIKQFCMFQTFGKSFLDFCVQSLNSPYRINLGSAGGPAVVCEGLPRSEHKQVEPCPFKRDGKILGWKIMLPAENTQ